MNQGPAKTPTSSAVIAAMTARKVRYWNTRGNRTRGRSLQPLRQADQHGFSSFCASACSDCSNRSMRMKRRALTSTDPMAGASASLRTAAHRNPEIPGPSARLRQQGAAACAIQSPVTSTVSMPRASACRSTPRRGRPGLVADLAHVAEREQNAGRQLGQHLDRGADRIGIGVVAVVDQRQGLAAQREAQHARTALTGSNSHRPRAIASSTTPAASAQAAAPASALRVVTTRDLQAGLEPHRRRARVKRQAPSTQSASPLTSAPAPPKVSTRRAPASSRHSGVYPSSAGTPPCRRPAGLEHRVLARDRLDARHKLLVLALRVVDQRHGRLRDTRQALDLARMVHAELDHGEPVRASGAARSAARRSRCSGCPASRAPRHLRNRAQDGRDHLCHRGLAVAAGHGNQGQRELCAPQPRQLASAARLSATSTPGRPAAPSPRSASAATAPGARLREIVIGVETLATQRDEQVALAAACGYRCTRPTENPASSPTTRAPGNAGGSWPASSCQLLSVLLAPGLQRDPACSRSEKGRLTPGDLPGSPRGPCHQQHDVARAGVSHHARDRGSVVRLDRDRCRAGQPGTHLVQDLQRVFRGAGCRWSAAGCRPRARRRRPSADACPDRGRRRSRPEQRSRPPRWSASGRSACSAFSSASGVWQ